jgi:hypothetical protein
MEYSSQKNKLEEDREAKELKTVVSKSPEKQKIAEIEEKEVLQKCSEDPIILEASEDKSQGKIILLDLGEVCLLEDSIGKAEINEPEIKSPKEVQVEPQKEAKDEILVEDIEDVKENSNESEKISLCNYLIK